MRMFLALLASTTMVAALAAAGPASAEQRPNAKPPTATAKPVTDPVDANRDSKKGGTKGVDDWNNPFGRTDKPGKK